MILCNDGTVVTHMESFIFADEGTYVIAGAILTGPGGFVSMNIHSADEAVGIVVGRHGGRRL